MNDDLLPDGWSFARRGEVVCPHGIGHPIPDMRDAVHGCDGCCAKDDFDNVVKKAKDELENSTEGNNND